MYSPVFLSWPTTSGSPPVISISFSDHSFSLFASSFACTFAHSRPLWRVLFFSKRGVGWFGRSSRCFGVNSLFFFFRLFSLDRVLVRTGGSQRNRAMRGGRVDQSLATRTTAYAAP